MRAPAASLGWVAVAMACVAGGCERRGAVREWRASDHTQPATPAEGSTPASDQTPGGSENGDDPEAVVLGAIRTWETMCVGCHGARGEGDGPERPPDMVMQRFSDQAWQATRTDFDFATSILDGKGRMPGFRGRIDNRSIAALVLIARSLGGRDHAGEPPQ